MAVPGSYHHRTRPHLAPVLQSVRPFVSGDDSVYALGTATPEISAQRAVSRS